ncbi:hypothetical protein ACJX0J_025692 [Zea mays]
MSRIYRLRVSLAAGDKTNLKKLLIGRYTRSFFGREFKGQVSSFFKTLYHQQQHTYVQWASYVLGTVQSFVFLAFEFTFFPHIFSLDFVLICHLKGEPIKNTEVHNFNFLGDICIMELLIAQYYGLLNKTASMNRDS